MKYMSYLHTIKHLSDFWGIFHFEEGAQVSGSVEELYLKTFVSKSDLTADKEFGIINTLSKARFLTRSETCIQKKKKIAAFLYNRQSRIKWYHRDNNNHLIIHI